MSNPVGRPTLPIKNQKIEFRSDEIIPDSFTSEKQIEDYFFENIKDMMKTIYNEVVSKAERQKRLCGQKYKVNIKKTGQLLVLSKCKAKIDIYVECTSGNKYIFEVKNSKEKDNNDSIYAISQLLFYSTLFSDEIKLVVLSNKYNDGFAEVVKRYNLPIEFLMFTKNHVFSLQK